MAEGAKPRGLEWWLHVAASGGFCLIQCPHFPDLKTLPWEDRLRLLPELLGIEAQLILNSMGEVGPVTYHLADLTCPPSGRSDG